MSHLTVPIEFHPSQLISFGLSALEPPLSEVRFAGSVEKLKIKIFSSDGGGVATFGYLNHGHAWMP
jgi:hypothetical protein